MHALLFSSSIPCRCHPRTCALLRDRRRCPHRACQARRAATAQNTQGKEGGVARLMSCRKHLLCDHAGKVARLPEAHTVIQMASAPCTALRHTAGYRPGTHTWNRRRHPGHIVSAGAEMSKRRSKEGGGHGRLSRVAPPATTTFSTVVRMYSALHPTHSPGTLLVPVQCIC